MPLITPHSVQPLQGIRGSEVDKRGRPVWSGAVRWAQIVRQGGAGPLPGPGLRPQRPGGRATCGSQERMMCGRKALGWGDLGVLVRWQVPGTRYSP